MTYQADTINPIDTAMVDVADFITANTGWTEASRSANFDGSDAGFQTVTWATGLVSANEAEEHVTIRYDEESVYLATGYGFDAASGYNLGTRHYSMPVYENLTTNNRNAGDYSTSTRYWLAADADGFWLYIHGAEGDGNDLALGTAAYPVSRFYGYHEDAADDQTNYVHESQLLSADVSNGLEYYWPQDGNTYSVGAYIAATSGAQTEDFTLSAVGSIRHQNLDVDFVYVGTMDVWASHDYGSKPAHGDDITWSQDTDYVWLQHGSESTGSAFRKL